MPKVLLQTRGSMITFDEWKDDPINSKKSYPDYIHEVIMVSDRDFYDQMIADCERLYLEINDKNIKVTIKDFIKLLKDRKKLLNLSR